MALLITYTHDLPEHMARIRGLSEKLRNPGGVDCRIDQQIQSPPEGWPKWCKHQIRDANFVFVVCTKTYLRRYEGEEEAGMGRGEQWEGHVMTQELYETASPVTSLPEERRRYLHSEKCTPRSLS
jgi:hypothetical protein